MEDHWRAPRAPWRGAATPSEAQCWLDQMQVLAVRCDLPRVSSGCWWYPHHRGQAPSYCLSSCSNTPPAEQFTVQGGQVRGSGQRSARRFWLGQGEADLYKSAYPLHINPTHFTGQWCLYIWHWSCSCPCRNHSSLLVGAPFPDCRQFQSGRVFVGQRTLTMIASLLIHGCGEHTENVSKKLWVSFCTSSGTEVEIKTRKGIHSQKKRLSVYSLWWSKENHEGSRNWRKRCSRISHKGSGCYSGGHFEDWWWVPRNYFYSLLLWSREQVKITIWAEQFWDRRRYMMYSTTLLQTYTIICKAVQACMLWHGIESLTRTIDLIVRL